MLLNTLLINERTEKINMAIQIFSIFSLLHIFSYYNENLILHIHNRPKMVVILEHSIDGYAKHGPGKKRKKYYYYIFFLTVQKYA